MSPLPLKIFYTLQEASIFLNDHLKRSDIDESYFFQLAMKGAIRLGIFTDPTFGKIDHDLGVIYSDYFSFEDDLKLVDYVETMGLCISTLVEKGSILILNSSDVKEVYLGVHNGLFDAFFDNIYSLDTQEFSISDEIQKAFNCFKYADKLDFSKYLEPVYFSRKHNQIHYVLDTDRKTLSFPEEESEDDWKISYWFNREYVYEHEDLYSDRKINRKDCLILGEDIEMLLNGVQRKPVERHPRTRENNKNLLIEDLKLHPKRENSINRIVLALATKAGLDLSSHITAYEKLNSFCGSHGLDLPNKDTCGKLFKAAHNLKNSN